LSQTALKKFEDRFCASKMAKGQCLVLPTPSGAKVPQNPTAIVSIGRELENTPTGQPVTLSVVPNWGALIGHLRASRKYQVQPQHIELDFKSGFLEIRLGPASTKFEPELDNFLKLWNLEQLSAGAVKR
jgi:hypothetical protein